VVKTDGSGNAGSSGTETVNPSGTAALSDYLRRYPDVAKEAKANPGAYGDVNKDGVIDDYDFALGHYILAGQYDGHKMNVKKGGYIQHPSRDTDMHNSPFQVMRKANGGAVVNPPFARSLPADPNFVPQNPAPIATGGILQALLGNPQGMLPAYDPYSSQPAYDPYSSRPRGRNRRSAVDPRTLAESYRQRPYSNPYFNPYYDGRPPVSPLEPGPYAPDKFNPYYPKPYVDQSDPFDTLRPTPLLPPPPFKPKEPRPRNPMDMYDDEGNVIGVREIGMTPDSMDPGYTHDEYGNRTGVKDTGMTPYAPDKDNPYYPKPYDDQSDPYDRRRPLGPMNPDAPMQPLTGGPTPLPYAPDKDNPYYQTITEGPFVGGSDPITGRPYDNPYLPQATSPLPADPNYDPNGQFRDVFRDVGDFNYGKPRGRNRRLAVDPRTPPDTRQSPYSGYEPGTMGGMYHYGESPTGETQHYNYALAEGAVAPWNASTPTGTGRYNMFGVKIRDDADPKAKAATEKPLKGGGSVTRNQFAVQGPGTGRSDSIPASLSDGEYVMDAETVALLGDGSSKAGAKKLDAMRGNLRKAKGRNLVKGRFSVNAKAPEAYLSGGRA
jgi:hypothetical protein